MQFEVYQLVVPLIGLYYMSRTVYQYTQRKRSAFGMAVWLIFWLGITILAIAPDLVSVGIAQLFGFKSNVTAIIFAALGFLFLFIFYLSTTIERLENQVTSLVRQLAIEDIKKNNRTKLKSKKAKK